MVTDSGIAEQIDPANRWPRGGQRWLTPNVRLKNYGPVVIHLYRFCWSWRSRSGWIGGDGHLARLGAL